MIAKKKNLLWSPRRLKVFGKGQPTYQITSMADKMEVGTLLLKIEEATLHTVNTKGLIT